LNFLFFFSSRRRHTRFSRDWSSDVCSSDLHLDANQELLPLFLDEVFVNWDGARRRNALTLLEQVSARRQVFFFTCHRWLAQEVKIGRASCRERCRCEW